MNSKVVCTIEIKVDEEISGFTHDCEITVNEDGDLTEPEAATTADVPSPLLDPKIDADTLAFQLRDAGETQAIKLEFKLTGKGSAELRFLDISVKIKPVRFDRK